MRSIVAIAAVAGCGLVLWLAWPHVPRAEAPTDASGAAESERASTPLAADRGSRPRPADAREPGDREAAVAPGQAADGASTAAAAATPAAVAWPVRAAAKRTARASRNELSAELEGKVELAFRALNYVGADPDAERTWLAAIRDARLPAGVRSDLIEDLNDEGYSDNSHPGKVDLPLIRARMALIERLMPGETDDVNRSAFAEAYKDLLEMLERLTGARGS